MSKRDPLRKLSKRFPAPPELKKALQAAGEQPDRAAAIVAAAIAESVLEKLIVKHLAVQTSSILSQLFENRGPLSDFHSKILIAVAFGIISQGQGEELHRVKAIRNVFAHAKTDITFDTPQISRKLRAF